MGELAEDLWVAYLRLCPNPADLSRAVLEALLDLPNCNLRHDAAATLLTGGHETAVHRVTDWLADGSLNLNDAAGLLAANPVLAAQTLSAGPVSEDIFPLLDRLGEIDPDAIVRVSPGQWVHTQAGWARIAEIRSHTGQSLAFAWRDRLEKDCDLYLTLRAGEKDEDKVKLHANGTLEFTGSSYGGSSSQRYQCGKCERFITRVQDCIGTHDRARHGGVGRQIYLFRATSIRQKERLQFSIIPPKSIWQ